MNYAIFNFVTRMTLKYLYLNIGVLYESRDKKKYDEGIMIYINELVACGFVGTQILIFFYHYLFYYNGLDYT